MQAIDREERRTRLIMRGTDHREEIWSRALEITPSTSGLPKVRHALDEAEQEAFARPGRINGSEMVANTVHSVHARLRGFLEHGLTPCTTRSHQEAIGVKAASAR